MFFYQPITHEPTCHQCLSALRSARLTCLTINPQMMQRRTRHHKFTHAQFINVRMRQHIVLINILTRYQRVGNVSTARRINLRDRDNVHANSTVNRAVIPRVAKIVSLFNTMSRQATRGNRLTNIKTRTKINTRRLSKRIRLRHGLRHVTNISRGMCRTIFRQARYKLTIRNRHMKTRKPTKSTRSGSSQTIHDTNKRTRHMFRIAIPQRIQALFSHGTKDGVNLINSRLITRRNLTTITLNMSMTIR